MNPVEILAILPPERLTRLRRNLRRWYRRHGRQLPWRAAGDPYRVWISEIMLQQTTVAAVAPYFERFLVRFPTVQSLAAANEGDVLRLWEGLGYYSRARNVHKTARLLADDFGAAFPRDVSALRALPGIGRYTAGAIASFAFDVSAPIVEANTLRLYCRLLGFEGDPRTAAGQQLLWKFAEHLIPRRRAGEFNQALMDLGATVCVPSGPKCHECPLHADCAAFQSGKQESIPAARSRIPLTELTEAAVAVRKRGEYLLRRRSDSERWAGLWDFPRFEVNHGNTQSVGTNAGKRLSATQAKHITQQVQSLTGIRIETPVLLTTLKHTVTRYRITLRCLHAEYASGRLDASSAPLRWVKPRDFGEYPLSVTGRKLADRITDAL